MRGGAYRVSRGVRLRVGGGVLLDAIECFDQRCGVDDGGGGVGKETVVNLPENGVFKRSLSPKIHALLIP